nr:NirD/YgiW/YdeI family stress tolerance protein [Candidatus Enterousia merdequi]
MKKISIITLCALMPICGAFAGSGMQNHSSNNVTQKYWSVTEVVNMPDDTPVVMMGYITKDMGDEMYVFEDASGTIMIEIDDSDWNGKTVRTDDVVTVYGKIDKKANGTTEIDVNSIVK